MSHNPPQIGDFSGDEIGWQKSYDAYNLGWLAMGNGKEAKDCPFPERTDENWFWKEGFFDNLEDKWD